MRYNGFLAADINGGAAPGFSSGQAQAAIARIAADTLPNGFDFEWTDLTYQEILAGNTIVLIFPLCVLLVFPFFAPKGSGVFFGSRLRLYSESFGGTYEA